KWTGTLASTGEQLLRVYPPQEANASVAAGDTYGQYAAYDSAWVGYWPDGGGNDRTGGEYHLTAYGSVSVGAATGKVGAATAYNGSSQYCEIASGLGVSSHPVTMMAWIKTEDDVGQ